METLVERMQTLGIELPEAPDRAGMYVQTKRCGNSLYISGCGPSLKGKPDITGKLGEISIEEGQEAARRCILNALAILQRDLGSLERVKSVVKILTFVASKPDFYNQPKVADGASKLLVDLFGKEIGCPTRSAIGVAVLPGDIPVEIELLVETD